MLFIVALWCIYLYADRWICYLIFSRLTCIYKGCFSFKVVVQTRALHLLLYVLFNCVDIFIWLSGICVRFYVILPSLLWHCWLGVRKSIRPVKIDWWCVGVVVCLERGVDCFWSYGPADATAVPKPHHLLPHSNPDWFYLSGTGLPGLSWKTGH